MLFSTFRHRPVELHCALPWWLLVFAAAGCVPSGDTTAFGPLKPWAQPIADAIVVGEEAFPNGFRRNITTLRAHEGRLWMGYGDGTANLGTVTPIEFRYFASADDPTVRAAVVDAEGHGALQRTLTDTGEEQIDPLRMCLGALCMAGSDAVNDDELWTQAKDPRLLIEGNFFRLEDRDGEPVWKKYRTVGGGEHVHDVAEIDGVIYAVGSGADNRAEWDAGQISRYLWKSEDGGESFSTVIRIVAPNPEDGDTRFRRLLALDQTLYVFGYVDPSLEGVAWEGRHLVMRRGEFTDLTGDLERLFVHHTLQMSPTSGLAITSGGRWVGGTTRAFGLDADGYRELTSWAGRRIVDVAPTSDEGEFFVLFGDAGSPETFTVHAFHADDPESLKHIGDLDIEAPSAMALFDGALFVGTHSGAIYRAARVD